MKNGAALPACPWNAAARPLNATAASVASTRGAIDRCRGPRTTSLTPSAAKKAGLDNIIPDFDDNAPYTAPVTSLPPNERGIAGLGGNVSEWTDTDYEKPSSAAPNPQGTVRGGSWRTANGDEALSSVRTPLPPDTKRNTLGFRIVVARKPVS